VRSCRWNADRSASVLWPGRSRRESGAKHLPPGGRRQPRHLPRMERLFRGKGLRSPVGPTRSWPGPSASGVLVRPQQGKSRNHVGGRPYVKCRGNIVTSTTASERRQRGHGIVRKAPCVGGATIRAGKTPQGLDGNLKPGHEWRMDVTNEFANPLYVLHISRERRVGGISPNLALISALALRVAAKGSNDVFFFSSAVIAA